MSILRSPGIVSCMRARAGRLILAALLLAPPVGSAQDLPVPVRENMLKEQAVGALKTGNVPALYQAMDEYRALEHEGAKVPAGLFLAEAETARSRNELVRAEHAFGDYFRVATPEGDAYSKALSVYAEFKRSVVEGIWPTLEGMVLLPGGTLPAQGASGPDEPLPRKAGAVPVKSFALAAREVTRGQFREFFVATNFQMQPRAVAGDKTCDLEHVDWQKPGFEQTDEDPVVCVSWTDVQAYVDWLNQTSGLRFRLPTEVEWEYAARAGTTTAYWYGDTFDANGDNGPGASGKDRWDTGTAPAGQFPANPFGLHDMHGNVSEWTRDCEGGSPEGAGNCGARVVRGGNWTSESAQSGAVTRMLQDDASRTSYLGFRLAMDQ